MHDHGTEFCNKELAAVVKAHDLIDIKTRPRHPESNGIAERFNGTMRDEVDNDFGSDYLVAVDRVDRIIDEYNTVRLHAALGYIEPKEFHYGKPDERRRVRAERLHLARQLRREMNKAHATRVVA